MSESKGKNVGVFGITTKLLIWFLCVALVPMAIICYVGYSNAVKILKKQSVDQLVTIADNKEHEIEDYILQLEEDITMIAHNPVVLNAIKEYTADYPE